MSEDIAAKPLLFPDNIQFWYEIKRAFGSSSYGGSEFGEVLATAARIVSGDFDSWYREWNSTAERLSEEAAVQLARGHRISARDGFLRAATYYRTSEFFLHGNPHDQRITIAYQKSVQAYKACAALFDPAIEPVEIPYEQTTLPGYFHRMDTSIGWIIPAASARCSSFIPDLTVPQKNCTPMGPAPRLNEATTCLPSMVQGSSVHCTGRV